MPKVAYSEEEREKIRTALLTAGLELMAKQGIQRTTVEQIYKKVGISRTFFYSYFPTKEDFIVEMLYLQQPKIIAYAQQLMADPELNWRQAVERFLHSCCYGEQNGIAVLTIEEQQGKHQPVYKSKPGSAGFTQSDSGCAAPVCSGSGRRNDCLSGQGHRGCPGNSERRESLSGQA